MNYEQAFEILKQGGSVERGGRTIILRRGLLDVSGDEPQRYQFSEEDRVAEDWTASDVPPEVVAPEAVDDVLAEEIVPATDD